MVMSFGSVHPGVSFSSIFVRLGGQKSKDKKAVVPLRGWPMAGEFIDDTGWIADRDLTLLVVRGSTEREVESDGTCITEAEAERFMNLKYNPSILLPSEMDSPTYKYYRIQNPDIHDVNWITTDELEHAVKVVETVDDGGFLVGYKAAIAAMRALEADPGVEMVRFLYGFDN
jgi:hypothetical protein